MSYEDWLWAKFGVLCLIAAIYGFWQGLQDLSSEGERLLEQSDKEIAEREDL